MGWRRSSRCDSGHCVEVSIGYATVWVRDSRRRTLVMSHADWRELLRAVRDA